MARTFDLLDPAQREAYLEHTVLHWFLYGGLYLTFNSGDGTVTVHDPEDVQIRIPQDEPGSQGVMLW